MSKAALLVKIEMKTPRGIYLNHIKCPMPMSLAPGLIVIARDPKEKSSKVNHAIALWSLLLSVLLRPLTRRSHSLCLISFPDLSDAVVEGVVRVRGAEEALDREEDGANLKCRGPLVLKLKLRGIY